MTQSKDLAQRLAFLDFRPEERVLLEESRSVLEAHADAFVASFYRQLLSFAPTRDLLRDPAVKDRLLVSQREYLLSLAGPKLDEDYLVRRRRIGEVHAEIGLEPRWYLGAYGIYQSFLTRVITRAYADDPPRATATLVAFGKLLLLDAEIAMETYISRQQSALEFLTEELATEGRRLALDYQDQSVELQQTADRARSAEELASVATLVAGLAHEIGTPMGVIQGHAKMLENAVTTDDAQWRLQTIQEQIGRISKIIQTLLGMARPRRTTRIPVALAPLVESSLGFVREKLARHQISVNKTIESVPSISGDSERLQQLLLNLFLNAADAMPDGGELQVSVTRESADEKADIVVAIRDTGIGIRARDIEHIFDPFFTTKSAGEGNGLGLMVCQGIVGDHGGTIDVTSEEGQGTEFRIAFSPA